MLPQSTDSRTCGARYERPGGAEPGDRIVHCGLPLGHAGGIHTELDDDGDEMCSWLATDAVVTTPPTDVTATLHDRRACEVPDCDRPRSASGFRMCDMHRGRYYRNGHLGPVGPYRPESPAMRLWANLYPAGSCWEWRGSRNRGGYGQISVDGRMKMAHRYSYELTKGPIPPGLMVMHSCDNPPCCNPAHLSAGTTRDNAIDSVNKNRHPELPSLEEQRQLAEMLGAGLGDAEIAQALGWRFRRAQLWRYRLLGGGQRDRRQLDPDSVREIRRLSAMEGVSSKALAARFGVTRGQIRRVIRGAGWANVA